MAFVHPQSCECLKSELDIFAVPPTQTSIESSSYVEYNPISSISDGTPIEFVITNGGQEYLDMANTQLFVTAQILDANNTAINNEQPVGPVNLLLHSLFSEVDIKLNDTLITSTNNTYPYRAYLETLLSYSKAAKESHLSSALFFKDVAGSMEERNPHDDDARNTGLIRRHEGFARGGTVDLMGRIHADMFFQDRYLINDVGVRIRLVRNTNEFCLMSAVPNASYKIKIKECKLYVRKVKVSPSILVAHAKALQVGNAKYPVRRAVCKTFTIPRGNLDFSQENVFSGQLPTRLVIAFVDNDAFNGTYAKNPFNFQNYSVTQLRVYLDGQQQHIRPLDLNFAESQYVSAYMTLFSGTGKQFKDEGNHISRYDFPNGYAIYAFDLTPDMAEDDHFNLIKQGNVRIDARFAYGLPNTINAIIYAEFENIIEIDRSRNVIFDYSN